jgi:hypothetical protein
MFRIINIPRAFLTVFFLILAIPTWAQPRIEILSGKKSAYNPGDKLMLLITVEVDAKTCVDGMAKTKIYSSGLKINGKTEWHELEKGLWQTKVDCEIIRNKKSVSQLTLVRKTDKDNIFKQLKFPQLR